MTLDEKIMDRKEFESKMISIGCPKELLDRFLTRWGCQIKSYDALYKDFILEMEDPICDKSDGAVTVWYKYHISPKGVIRQNLLYDICKED